MGRLKTKKAYSDSNFTNLVETYIYDNDAAGTAYTYYGNGRISSMTLTSADESGMVYYHYLDENWNSQGYGRVDKQIRSDGIELIPGSQVRGFMQGSTLIIVGVGSNNSIKISQNTSGVTVNSSTGDIVFTGTINGIDIYTFDGNDSITITSSVLVSTNIYAGSGNDQLFADNGVGDILVGGYGDDLFVTINGDLDTIIGGEGFDSFWCDTSDIIKNISSAEYSYNTIHQISQFYQPFTKDTTNANYVPLTLAGQKLSDPTDSGTTGNASSFPLFNDGRVYYNDIGQGYLGDCYFLAGLASLASMQPETILQSIAPMGDGTYGVRFYNDNGVPQYLRIDGDIPASGGYPKYANFGTGGDTWAMLLEKAYALFRVPGQNTYSSLYGGIGYEAFTTLTGLGSGFLKNSLPNSDADYYNCLQSQLSTGHAITLVSSGVGDIIVPEHVYSLQSVKTINGVMYATVYNPWRHDGGSSVDEADDGLLTLTISNLRAYFSYEFFSSGPTR